MIIKFYTIIIILIVHLSYDVRSATYYLSSSFGNDLNSGTQINSPWQTLNRLNNHLIFAGDSILLKAGDEFYGTINLKTSGNISSPIYFGKYLNGPRPIISGFKKLNGWNITGNIYTVNDTNAIKSIWCNGKWMQPARFPNNGFLYTQFDGLNSAVFSPELNQPNGYWDNSTVVVRTAGYKYERAEVDTFEQGFLYFLNPVSTLIPGFSGYFIENNLASLDSANEWYYDKSSGNLYIIPPINGNLFTSDVEASVLDFGFISDSAVDYIFIDSINFTGQAIDAIRLTNASTGIRVMNCHFSKVKQHALNFLQLTTSANILYNEIKDCGGDAIFSYFFYHCRIMNNNILRTGMNVGFGMNDVFTSKAINISIGSFDTISDNYIDSTAYSGIYLYGYSNLIERNYINNSLISLEGGGGLVLTGSNTFNNYIRDNHILNTQVNYSGAILNNPISTGIFLGYYCHNNSIIHNTIVNSASYGIYFGPKNQNHYLNDNVFYNNQEGQLFIDEVDTISATNNIELRNNIFYSLSDKQKVIKFNGPGKYFYPLKGDSNYYCNPYDYYPFYQQTFFDTINEEKVFSLPLWNQTTFQDSNSHVSNVEWQNYFVTDTTDSDQIVNGNFTNNYDTWNIEPATNNLLLLENLTMMNDGCIKFEVTDTVPYDYAKIISADFPVQSNQFYELSFSTAGTNNGILHSNMNIQYPPYAPVGFNKYFPIYNARKDFTYFFQSSNDANPVALNFELHKSDSLVYFDNIHLFPVSVFKHDSSRMSVLLMNYSPNIVSVPLGADSVFRDLDGNLVTGTYTLNPYSSYVLVLDSPLNLVSVKEIQKQNSIFVYPNPVQSSNGKVVVQLPDENKYDYEVYDLTGRKFLSGKLSISANNCFSMKNASAGMYILSVHSANKLWQQKIVVVN